MNCFLIVYALFFQQFSTLPKSFPKRTGKLSSLSIAELSNLNIHQASTLPLRSKMKTPEIVLSPPWNSGPIIEKPEDDSGTQK